MDGRQALAPGTKLTLHTKTGYALYTIKGEIGRGGSSIVYDASYTDNLGNYKMVRIKECYPQALRLTRDESGAIHPSSGDPAAFDAAKNRMTGAYRRNHQLFSLENLTNAVVNTSDIYQANGTVYVVSVYVNGRTFAEYQGETMHDCVSLLLAAAKTLKQIHEAGYLYLDLKPDNILTVRGTFDLVQLFDFDSMVSAEKLNRAVREDNVTEFYNSYTRGYAAPEQQAGRLRQMGIHSDFYSLGAVLFYALWKRTPSAYDCDSVNSYDYDGMIYSSQCFQDRLFRALTAFLHKTLASYYGDRYQSDDEVVSALIEILTLSDETRPWLRSTSIQPVSVFYGREKELAGLAGFLDENDRHVCSLYGLGGIGKSTLVRRYITENASRWDAVIMQYDHENLSELIADDTQVQLNTISRLREETGEEYCRRKLQALAVLATSQRILIVLDNFDPVHLDQIRDLSGTGVTLLLISRDRLPEGLFQALRIGEMRDEDLAQMFGHYAHCDVNGPGKRSCFEELIKTIDRHTLLTELIARQIAGGYLDLETAGSVVSGTGLSVLSAEKIDYVHDQTAYRGTLLKILDKLVEIDHFSAQDKCCMKLLSLFSAPGIENGLFRQLTGSPDPELIHSLETAGWLKRDGSLLVLHSLMQEYIRSWPWTPEMNQAADRLMQKLYGMLLPAGKRPDTDRQFPENPEKYYGLLRLADQVITYYDGVTEASRRLLFRWLMDAPVDQDARALLRMLNLLEDPRFLDDDSILRLYETAAYYQARLFRQDAAIELLREMRQYLRKHPSAYYLSAYHRAMSVILHNNTRDLKQILHHEARAITAARMSAHPEAGKQLAACLMNKARTLMSEEKDQKQVRKLMQEAEPIVFRYTEPHDYERYQYVCNAAMCCAMDGDREQALKYLDEANAIVYASSDSDLAIAEHLIEEVAPIRIELEQFDAAEEAVRQAVRLCEKHPEAVRYRETAYDAAMFLGRILNMDGKSDEAEKAFAEAEKWAQDSP